MERPGYAPKEDFLSMLLEDELFKGKDDTIVDECMTFMSAGT
jgi:cytochrome P450